MAGPLLQIPFTDLLRATLADNCGNVGFIGVAPDGSAYHVVVPVDLQIARGVKACNRPTDGTPFGGYAGWHYFQCMPYPAGLAGEGERQARELTAQENKEALQTWAATLGMALEVG